MQRCIKIARHGLGNVSPNPLVGCVIVYDGKIIAEGYHAKYGEPHAEVNAINNVKDKSILSKSTLYVNLEPCSHFGKTPPCTDLIIRHKIPRVVIGCTDTNILVSGRGILKLTAAGVDVSTGILEKESRELNRRFFTFHEKKRPFIILKWAQTKDGFIDIIREPASKKKPNWITSENTRAIIHKWRTEEDAVIVGTQTALLDNPCLTARNWEGKNPCRIVLDRVLKIPKHYNLFDNSAQTIVFNTIKNRTEGKINYIKIEFDENILNTILDVLFKANIQSLIVEGGTKLLNSFIYKNLWDEAVIFEGEKIYDSGIKSPDFSFTPTDNITLGSDKIMFYSNVKL